MLQGKGSDLGFGVLGRDAGASCGVRQGLPGGPLQLAFDHEIQIA